MIFGLTGAGFMLGHAGRPAPPPLVIERRETAPLPLRMEDVGATAQVNSTATANESGAGASKPETRYGPDGTDTERPTDPAEVVSICGARTQKGTPCQRRVRGTGRCWQHRGKSAMLPASKLIVPE